MSSSYPDSKYLYIIVVGNKKNEIKSSFVKGVGAMLKRCKTDNEIAEGLKKLWNLKEFYENQLLACQDVEAVEDIEVCFHCFDKKEEGECRDCD